MESMNGQPMRAIVYAIPLGIALWMVVVGVVMIARWLLA